MSQVNLIVWSLILTVIEMATSLGTLPKRVIPILFSSMFYYLFVYIGLGDLCVKISPNQDLSAY